MRSIPEPACPFWQSYRQRSRVWRWPAIDELGVEPTFDALAPHLHADAHELFFAVRGRAQLKVGRRLYMLDAGAVAIVPPGTYHALERGTDEVVDVLAVVAPNDAIEPFVFEGFTGAAFEEEPVTFAANEVAPGPHFCADGLSVGTIDIRGRERSALRTPADAEAAIVVVAGAPVLRIDRLGARLEPGQHVSVPPDCDVAVEAGDEPVRCLLIEARRLPAFCVPKE